ncbi:MAG: hypothetical protein IJ542_03265 [Clostridia bacterium]|nr:hypothetical protein [Clostridia bacterium]
MEYKFRSLITTICVCAVLRGLFEIISPNKKQFAFVDVAINIISTFSIFSEVINLLRTMF